MLQCQFSDTPHPCLLPVFLGPCFPLSVCNAFCVLVTFTVVLWWVRALFRGMC